MVALAQPYVQQRSVLTRLLLRKADRVAGHVGLTGHDVWHSLNDWLDAPLDLGAIEDGRKEPTAEEAAALAVALQEYHDCGGSPGFVPIGAIIRKVIAKLERGEPIQ